MNTSAMKSLNSLPELAEQNAIRETLDDMS